MLFAFLVVSLLVAGANAASVSCSSLQSTMNDAQAKLPCYEVHSCATPKLPTTTIHQLSSGSAAGSSSATVSLCYSETGLQLHVEASGQNYFPDSDAYTSCNDGIFNSDVVEFFITGPSTVGADGSLKNDLHCYSELDVNPHDKIFESGIYNPNLNHSGVQNILIECSESQITHKTSVKSHSWTMDMTAPFTIIDTPVGCPDHSMEDAALSPSHNKAGTVYRGNFYRINELVETSKCSSSLCEYLAWSPTGSTPPAFHEPTKFGYLVLV